MIRQCTLEFKFDTNFDLNFEIGRWKVKLTKDQADVHDAAFDAVSRRNDPCETGRMFSQENNETDVKNGLSGLHRDDQREGVGDKGDKGAADGRQEGDAERFVQLVDESSDEGVVTFPAFE